MRYENVSPHVLVAASLYYSGMDEFTTDVRRIGLTFQKIQREGERYFPRLSELGLQHLSITPDPPSYDIWSTTLEQCFSNMTLTDTLKRHIYGQNFSYVWGDKEGVKEYIGREMPRLTREQRAAIERFGEIVRKEMAYQV